MRPAPDERERRDREQRYAAASRLQSALRRGDVIELLRLVGPGVRVVVDGGDSIVSARAESSSGVEGWRLLRDAVRRSQADSTDWEIGSVNGAPGLIGTRDGEVVEVITFAGSTCAMTNVWIVCNADKLRQWNR
jgi:hypothetical protein